MYRVQTMVRLLQDAHGGGYAVGSFSARYTKLIHPIIAAAIKTESPVIVQLSEKEILRHKVSLKAFAEEFHRVVAELQPRIPMALHLDHTKTLGVIQEAIEVGFTSVMIDASEKDFAENAAITKKVVELAHARQVSVEGELGKIGTTDMVETDSDHVLFTNPQEAFTFIRETGVDALAISVGTSHGLYTTTRPKIEYAIIEAINRLTSTPLVLHGGSGVPSEMLYHAISMESGGVSKVNIATDLEQMLLKCLGKHTHMTEAELNAVDAEQLQDARDAVQALVEDKIINYVHSAGRAAGA